MRYPPVEHTRDRDGVGEHQCNDLQRNDRIECYRRANVYQRKQTGDDAG